MTPKEKAKELVNSFDHCLNNIDCGSNGIEDLILDRAKQCALLCVDEILLALPTAAKYTYYAKSKISICDYWLEVRKEIEKL